MTECTICCTNKAVDEKGEEIDILYGIISRTVTVEGLNFETYGIAVCSKAESTVGWAEVYDISADREEVAALVETLCRCQVTALTLSDVVADYIVK